MFPDSVEFLLIDHAAPTSSLLFKAVFSDEHHSVLVAPMVSRIPKDFTVCENVDLASHALAVDFDDIIEPAPSIRQLWRAIRLAMSVKMANHER